MLTRDDSAHAVATDHAGPVIETRPFDVQNYLTTPEDRAAYLDAILEQGDPSLIAAGLGEIAKAVGVTEFARQTGLSREASKRVSWLAETRPSTRSPRRRRRSGFG